MHVPIRSHHCPHCRYSNFSAFIKQHMKPFNAMEFEVTRSYSRMSIIIKEVPAKYLCISKLVKGQYLIVWLFSCRKCISILDHHCFFLGRCVGRENLKFFILFCFYASFGTGYGLWHVMQVNWLGNGFFTQEIGWYLILNIYTIKSYTIDMFEVTGFPCCHNSAPLPPGL